LTSTLGLAALLLVVSPRAFAQGSEPTLAFPPAALESEQALAEAMPGLAKQALALYSEPDRSRYLSTIFRLQLVAGELPEAVASLHELIELRRATEPAAAARLFPFATWAKAKVRQAAGGISLDDAFKVELRALLSQLDDAPAQDALSWFGGDLGRMAEGLRTEVEKQKGKDGISLPNALDLARAYLLYHSFEVLMPLAASLSAEDDARRYALDQDVLIGTPDGAQVAAIVMRPKAAKGPLSTLLGFTIYARDDWSLEEARRTAAHGYAAVVAYSRGKGRSPGAPVPYEHDGEDARAVIEWIAKQSWSDGRVGMYGGSYNGFTQWAAAKRRPNALKALMPSVTNIPGIDTPMQGNVFLNFVYPWGPYVTAVKGLDEEKYGDQAHWSGLYRSWYKSGRPYRELERIDGQPNPVFRRWLEHPSYDAYWQGLVPYGKEFADIDIPVLTTTGYFDGGQVGALYTFTEHYKHNPKADHYFLIGPYTHLGAQRRSDDVVQGYAIDPVARLDIRELRYQWFDFVFKGGKKPELLRDRINFQVMGANEWKHAPSIAAMSSESLRFHLSAARTGDSYRLSEMEPEGKASIAQQVDFADRGDVDSRISTEIVDKRLDTSNSLAFVTDPFERPIEVSGLFAGRLDFVVNKKDLDIEVDLYELMPSGEYMQLTVTPAYLGRASYAKSRSRRQLLVPGKRQTVDFRSERLTSRKLSAGSRLVMVLGVVKSADLQINYGTGKDVSDESIEDAKVPLKVEWFATSYLEVPVSR
jgi:putative CocE/NonD family hydrolase